MSPQSVGAVQGRKSLPACLALLLLATLSSMRSAAQSAPQKPLTTVRQIHLLTPEAAERHVLIRIRGVVTTLSAYPNAFFMQDATGGVSLEGDRNYGVFPGAEIEVTGETGAGLFAPVVTVSHVRILGKSAFPKAPFFNYAALTGGLQDSNWITLRGIVHTTKPKVVWGHTVLSLTVEVDGKLVGVDLMDSSAGNPERLVDSVVTVRGVCTTSFNDKRQFTGIGMITPSMEFIDAEKEAAPDPFSLAVTPVRSLLQFQPGARSGHRMLVHGTVTYQDPGRALYVQDGTDGVLVETDEDVPLPLGTRVAVVGFPDAGAYSPILRHSVFRSLRVDQPLPSISIRGDDLLHKSTFITAPFDAQLITLKGQLVELTHGLNDDTWLLRDGQNHFVAVLKRQQGSAADLAIEAGSLVSATGVLSVQVDEDGDPTIFRVLLRGPADLAIIKSASWWSPRHIFPVLLTAILLTLSVALWGATLRRTVRQQTRMLRESEERFRNQAQHDALTGLVSRSYLHEQLQEAIRNARFSGEKPGLLMVDLDFFKQVNDTLGHHAGDELLRVVAGRLRAAVRKTDVVARMGGDEFVVLLANLNDLAEAEEIGTKVVASVSAPAEIAGCLMPISASVGVCLYPHGGRDSDTLLQNVDTAMYKAKAGGRNSCAVYSADAKESQPSGLPVLSPLCS